MSTKTLFWFSGDLTSFCLAYYLQKKIDSDFFAIIETYDKPKTFFKNQNLVKIQKSWFYYDYFQKMKKPDLSYLQNFEKKYDINLWELAINERIFYRFNEIYKFSNDEILLILEHECKLFENILQEINPDFLIMSEPTLHHHELLYKMCKKVGVKILLYNRPNISRCIISENPRKLDNEIDFNNLTTSNRTFDELLSYRKSLDYYGSIKNFRHKFKTSNLELFKSFLKFSFTENQHIKTHYSHRGRTKTLVLKNEITKKLKRKFRNYFINKNFETKIDSKENFVYFPLAIDEERNLLISTPFYTNQIEIIRHIAKSLPPGFKLYVKENPAQKIRYWRNISDYKEIMAIPNVLLFHPSFSAEKLYENCSLVITIGGSSGLEATFYQKPSIVFADLGYSILPSVSKLNRIDELPKTIRESLQKKVSSADLDKYLTLLHSNSFDFNPLDLQNKYDAFFYYGGHYQSVTISEEKMKCFLDDNKETLEKFASEYEKKINLSK